MSQDTAKIQNINQLYYKSNIITKHTEQKAASETSGEIYFEQLKYVILAPVYH